MLSTPSFYDQIMNDDAMMGPSFAEAKWYPHEVRRAPLDASRHLIVTAPGPLGAVKAMLTLSLMDCVIEKRGYCPIPRLPEPSFAATWRNAVASISTRRAA